MRFFSPAAMLLCALLVGRAESACPRDLRTCPDGSSVVRDPANDCEFPQCECPPKGWTLFGPPSYCNANPFFLRRCEPGFEHWAHSGCGCGCKPITCPTDEKTCPDNTTVARDPKSNCEFRACPIAEPVLAACARDLRICPDGSSVGRDAANNCEFPACPVLAACARDLRICPDGSSVGRDAANNCEFPACPITEPVVAAACPRDLRICPDGSSVGRDPANDCAFPQCECPPKGWTLFGPPSFCQAEPFFLRPCAPGFEHWYDSGCGCGCRPRRVA